MYLWSSVLHSLCWAHEPPHFTFTLSKVMISHLPSCIDIPLPLHPSPSIDDLVSHFSGKIEDVMWDLLLPPTGSQLLYAPATLFLFSSQWRKQPSSSPRLALEPSSYSLKVKLPLFSLLLISSSDFIPAAQRQRAGSWTWPFLSPTLSTSQLLDETDPHLQLQGGSNSSNVLPLHTATDLERGRKSDSGHLEMSLHIVIDYADPIRVNGRTSVSCHSGLYAVKTWKPELLIFCYYNKSWNLV